MKRTLLVLMLVGAAAGTTFAQGQVTAQNTAATVIRLDPDPNKVLPADRSLAGQPIPTTGPLPSGIFLDYGLYVGSSSSSLLLVTTIPINTAAGNGQPAGQIPPTRVILPSPFAGGTAWTFQQKVWDAAFSSFESEQAAVGLYNLDNSDYLGESAVFTMTPSSGPVPTPIDTGGGSTMPQVPLDVLVVLPEPSVGGLAGLGAGSVWVFARARRRPSVNCAR